MADESTEQQGGEASAPKKKSPLMAAIVVAVLMLVEGVGIFVVVKMTSGSPSAAAAADIEGQAEAEAEAMQEIMLVEEKFQNMQSGRVWLWDTQIFMKVRTKNQPTVAKVLERRQAEVKEGVALIFRKAQDRHLREPGLETINRQLKAYVDEVFGTDPDGFPRVERIIIPTCKGFPADF